jgi:hypothetical protein
MALKEKATVTTGGLTPRQIIWLQGDRDGYKAALKPWEFGWHEAELLDEHGDAYLAEFVKAHPGRRPFWWWNFDPKSPEEPRRLIGGTGEPRKESHPDFGYDFGVPDKRSWNTRFGVKYDGPLDGEPLDPADPPTFESQAAYLKRHALFLPGEEKRLPSDAFEPESVLDIVEVRHVHGE